MLQYEWTLCSCYIREACILKKAKEKHCTPSSLLPQYVSKSFTAAWLIRFMNEPDGITLIHRTSGWWNNTEITCHSMPVQYWMLSLNSGAILPPQTRWQPTNAAAELHSAMPLPDPDFQIKLPTCPLFFPARDKGDEGKKTLQASCLFTFLCLPLNTTAKAPCPTRSFLLYSKSPTVSIVVGCWSSWCWALLESLECCSPLQKIILE